MQNKKNSMSQNHLLNKSHIPRINSYSSMLANKKKPFLDNVHDRLHGEAVRKHKQASNKMKFEDDSFEASSIMMRNNNKSGNRSFRNQSTQRKMRSLVKNAQSYRDRTPNNIGERLYQNGLKRLEEKQRKNHNEKIMREMSEVENLTFRPKINPLSRYFGRDHSDKKLEDHLIERGKKTKEHLEKKRNEILYETQHKHSFKPKINRNSERIILERSRQYLEESAAMFSNSESSNNRNANASLISSNKKLDKFMLLYDDAIKRKQRKDNIYSKWLDSECTFQPDLAYNQYYESTYTNPEDVVERLNQPSKTKEFLKIKYLHEEQYDQKTGQPLFRPKTGRPPLAKRDNLMGKSKILIYLNKSIVERGRIDEVDSERYSKLESNNSSGKKKQKLMKAKYLAQEKSEEILDQK